MGKLLSLANMFSFCKKSRLTMLSGGMLVKRKHLPNKSRAYINVACDYGFQLSVSYFSCMTNTCIAYMACLFALPDTSECKLM